MNNEKIKPLSWERYQQWLEENKDRIEQERKEIESFLKKPEFIIVMNKKIIFRSRNENAYKSLTNALVTSYDENKEGGHDVYIHESQKYKHLKTIWVSQGEVTSRQSVPMDDCTEWFEKEIK